MRERAHSHHHVDFVDELRAVRLRAVFRVGLLQSSAELLRVNTTARAHSDDGVADGALDGVAVVHAVSAQRQASPVECLWTNGRLERVCECGPAGEARHGGRVSGDGG